MPRCEFMRDVVSGREESFDGLCADVCWKKMIRNGVEEKMKMQTIPHDRRIQSRWILGPSSDIRVSVGVDGADVG